MLVAILSWALVQYRMRDEEADVCPGCCVTRQGGFKRLLCCACIYSTVRVLIYFQWDLLCSRSSLCTLVPSCIAYQGGRTEWNGALMCRRLGWWKAYLHRRNDNVFLVIFFFSELRPTLHEHENKVNLK